MDVTSLPVEIIQHVAYETGILNPKDVLAFALTSKNAYAAVLGPLGSENAFDKDQHSALGGVLFCAEKGWWNAVLLAIKRGYGDVEEVGGKNSVDSSSCSYSSDDEEYSECGQDKTPFMLACEAGEAKVVKALLNCGVEPTIKALLLACWMGGVDVVATLLEDGRVDPGGNENGAIRAAARNGHIDIIRLLLADNRADPAFDNNHILCHAAEFGHIEVVQLLLADHRVDPAADNDYPIRMAARYGRTEVVQLLLMEPHVNPAADDDYAICSAAEFGHTEVVQALLADHRVNPAADNNFPLRVATKDWYVDLMQILLVDPRVDPAVNDNLPLHTAARNGYLEIVQLLLDTGRVSPSAQQSAHSTAVEKGHTAIAQLLAHPPALASAAADPSIIIMP